MPWTQPPTDSASVHHPEANKHTNSSFGVVTLAGISGPTTGAEGLNGGAIMAPVSSLSDPFTTYPTMNGMLTVPGPMLGNGAGSPSGDSQLVISQDESLWREKPSREYTKGVPNMSRVGPWRISRITSYQQRLASAVDPEDDLTTLKTHLVENGADMEAANSCGEVVKDGISKEVLQKRLTREQCKVFTFETGNGFRGFLKRFRWMAGRRNRMIVVLYKNHRDVLRHFHKDHFGLWSECTHW